MNNIQILLIVVAVCISLAMMFLVFMQNPKSSGTSYGQGPQAGIQQLVGAAHVTHFLEKLTYWFIGIIIVLCVSVNYIGKSHKASGPTYIAEKKVSEAPNKQQGESSESNDQ